VCAFNSSLPKGRSLSIASLPSRRERGKLLRNTRVPFRDFDEKAPCPTELCRSGRSGSRSLTLVTRRAGVAGRRERPLSISVRE
jgi:hypothetical protein